MLTCAFALFGCGCSDSATSGQRESTAAMHEALQPQLTKTVATVSYPLQYLTQRIAGPEINVICPGNDVLKGQNWQPSSADVADMQAADVIIANGPGAPYADWLNRISVSDDKICNSAGSLATKDFVMVKDHKIVHQHGPEGEHSHPYMVAHTWLDPAIAKKQAATIGARLSNLYPEQADSFQNNLVLLINDLDRLSDQLAILARSASEGVGDSITVMTINPSLKFLTRAAGINDRHLLWFDAADDGQRKQQFESALKEIRGEAQQTVHLLIPVNVDLGISQTLGSDDLSNYAVEVHFIDAMDMAPPDGDYLSVMESNIKQLTEIVGK